MGSLRTNTIFKNGFYVDNAYEVAVAKTIYASDRAVTYIEQKWIDKGIHGLVYLQVIFAHVISWIDSVLIDGMVNGIARLTGFGGKITRSFQGGNIQLYIFWAVFAIIIFIIWTLN
jgi:NADH-quinone oxidoreductase subunit L